MIKIKQIFALLFTCMSLEVLAHEVEAPPANIAIYIHPTEYNHPLHLQHFTINYWFSQGPMLEKAALQILEQDFKGVTMCDAQPASAQVMLWLRPRMVYNPQIQAFYAKVTAHAYRGGQPIGSYVAEGTRYGFLGIQPAYHLQAAYKETMKTLSIKMRQDQAFQDALKGSATALPCATTGLLQEPKIRFMGF